MSKYTAKDFEVADFARHPDGGRAHRTNEHGYTWAFDDEDFGVDSVPGHDHMVKEGWIPERQGYEITASRDLELCKMYNSLAYSWERMKDELGVVVVDDPTPEPDEETRKSMVSAVWGLEINVNDAGMTGEQIAQELARMGKRIVDDDS